MTQPRETGVKVTSRNSWRIKAKNTKPMLGAGYCCCGHGSFPGGQSSPLWDFSDILAQRGDKIRGTKNEPLTWKAALSPLCAVVLWLSSPHPWASLLSDRCLEAALRISILLGKHWRDSRLSFCICCWADRKRLYQASVRTRKGDSSHFIWLCVRRGEFGIELIMMDTQKCHQIGWS